MEARQTDSLVPREVAQLWVSCLKRVLRQSLSVFGIPYQLKDRIEMAEGLCEGNERRGSRETDRTNAEVC